MSTIVVTISIQYYSEALEVVFTAEDGAGLHAVPDVPYREAISEQVLTSAVYLELNLKLPVARLTWLVEEVIR